MGQQQAKKLSKKEVTSKIQSGEFIYDAVLSDSLNLMIYKSSLGKILVKLDNGTGGLWESMSAIMGTDKDEGSKKSDFDLRDWIYNKEQLETVSRESLDILSSLLNTKVEYKFEFIALLDKYLSDKKKAINKTVFRALVYFSCEVFASKLGGYIDIRKIEDGVSCVPIVRDKDNLEYAPYSDFIECLVEGRKSSLDESIDIELYRYKLR